MTADMASAYGQIALIAAGLVFILVGAVLMPGIARVFFVTQIVYWTLAFVARPLVLLTVRPLPQFGDNIADPRLSDLGYGYSITHVLQPIAISIWIYAALVIAVAAFLRACGIWNESTRIWKPDPKLLMILAIAYVIGLAGRLAAFATGSLGSAGDVTSSNPYLDILSGMAGLAALGLIIYVRLSPLFNSALIAVLLAGELIWGIAIESKTPALSAAVGVAVRFAILGWNKYRLAGLGVGAVVVLAGFGWLQSFKVSEEDKLASRAATASYPHVVQPFLSLLRRFDLLEASTDVYYMDGRPWIGAGSAVEYGFSNLIPSQLGVTKFQSGTEWAQEVRGSSVDMRNISVSPGRRTLQRRPDPRRVLGSSRRESDRHHFGPRRLTLFAQQSHRSCDNRPRVHRDSRAVGAGSSRHHRTAGKNSAVCRGRLCTRGLRHRVPDTPNPRVWRTREHRRQSARRRQDNT